MLNKPLENKYECFECGRKYPTPEASKMCASGDKGLAEFQDWLQSEKE